ncbi:MAG: FliH/SctL family protein [Thermodesulfobacteriota bacterium]|nr:FliH/SctL family protein [Thermodesulfobacteriota bacterium]
MSSRIIKSQHVKLTGSRKKTPAEFTRGIYHISENKADSNARENSRDIDAESEEISVQAEERVKIVSKEAYDRGFSEGVTEGMDRKKRELSLAAESVAKLVRELKRLKEELLKSSEKEIIDLVFSIARKIIHKEVSADREVVLSVLKDAMKNMQEKDGVRIRLNPEDYHYITEVKPDFLDSFGDMSIEKDEEIGQGGAVIETHLRAVDARLDQQLNKIRESLTGC